MLLSLSLLLPLVLPATSDCPSPWVSAPSYLDLGCLLIDTTAELNWEEASTFCQDLGASLLEVPTEAGLDFLRLKLMDSAAHQGSRSWWSSGRYSSGEWRWGSGRVVEPWVWREDQPNSPDTENCLYMCSQDFLGCDVKCEYGYYPICQKK